MSEEIAHLQAHIREMGASLGRQQAELEELRAFKQAVLDPENQPSQFGTVLVKP